jgi:hypothetical protein
MYDMLVQSPPSPLTTWLFSSASRLRFVRILSGGRHLFVEIPTSPLKVVSSSTMENFSFLNPYVLTFFFLVMILVSQAIWDELEL